MIKILSLLLAVVLCISLCACGNNDENKATETEDNGKNSSVQSESNSIKSEIAGEWKANVLVGNSGDGREYAAAVIRLNEDGTGTYKDKAITWELSSDGNAVNFYLITDNVTGNFKIQTTDGKTTLNFYQDVYYRASEFAEDNG